MNKENFTQILLKNQPRKLAAIVLAFIVWILVNDSITITKTFSKVPVHIINLKSDRTVLDLLPDGRLLQRVNITISGPKRKIEILDARDLEVVVDASDREDEWVADISKKSVVCLNSQIDLQGDSFRIMPVHFIIKLSKLVSEKILVKINPPTGEAPEGYEFLDIWPQVLSYNITGAEEKLKELKNKGVELIFDLNRISKEELDLLQGTINLQNEDEISFFVPKQWQKLSLQQGGYQEVDTLSASKLRINFLRKNLLQLNRDLPLHLFFPLRYSAQLNPETYSLFIGGGIANKNGIKVLTVPLYVGHVSRLFLDVVRDYLEVAIVVDPENQHHNQRWSVEFVNPVDLEERYIQLAMKEIGNKDLQGMNPIMRKEFLRLRFQKYMHEFSLFTALDMPLNLEVGIKRNIIFVRVIE